MKDVYCKYCGELKGKAKSKIDFVCAECYYAEIKEAIKYGV